VAADYFVHLACAPKLALGSGDAQRGTWVLLEMLKAGRHAAALQQHAKQQGQSPAGLSVTVGSAGPGASGVEKSFTYEELVSQNSRLETHASACVGCPASFGHPFGCYSIVPYPISRAAEEWLMNLVQPTSMVGGFLCSNAMKDLAYTGEPIQKMRTAGLLESSTPVTKVVEGSWLSKKNINSNQILQGMLAIGEPIDPSHCMSVLLWLGLLKLDGKSLFGGSDAPLVGTILDLKTPEERRLRTAFEVGAPRDDHSTASLQSLLKAFYLAFVLGVPILMEY
jgi:hypothetical protein